MNLYFNMAVHALTYLVKHAGESFSSQELAELICVNPVQLRSVMRPLVEHQLVISKKGKFGGYSVDAHIGEIYLDQIFLLFREVEQDSRIYTGTGESHCEIARNMTKVMKSYAEQEYQALKNLYSGVQLKDVLNKIEAMEAVK